MVAITGVNSVSNIGNALGPLAVSGVSVISQEGLLAPPSSVAAVLQIQFRRGSALNWTNSNPLLLAGEPGFESDTGRLKVGDGVNAWTSLPYIN